MADRHASAEVTALGSTVLCFPLKWQSDSGKSADALRWRLRLSSAASWLLIYVAALLGDLGIGPVCIAPVTVAPPAWLLKTKPSV